MPAIFLQDMVLFRKTNVLMYPSKTIKPAKFEF